MEVFLRAELPDDFRASRHFLHASLWGGLFQYFLQLLNEFVNDIKFLNADTVLPRALKGGGINVYIEAHDDGLFAERRRSGLNVVFRNVSDSGENDFHLRVLVADSAHLVFYGFQGSGGVSPHDNRYSERSVRLIR